MQVTVNGSPRQIESGTTVADLVAAFKLQPTHVAVEVNCDLVTRRDYPQRQLKDGDQVEIVTLVGGG